MRMGTLAAGLLAATACTGAASAQQSSSDWAGFFIGGGIGYTAAPGDVDETLAFDTNRDGAFNDRVRTTTGADAFGPGFCPGIAAGTAPRQGCDDDDGKYNASIRAGYDWQTGPFVFGGVAEATFLSARDSVSGFSTTPASYTFQREIDVLYALRARGGYAMGSSLAYLTAGAAMAEVNQSFQTSNTANSFTPTAFDNLNGYQYGAGLETKLTGNLVLGFEYLYTSLKDDEYQIDVGPGTAPLTNPFRIVNPSGTFMRRANDEFELHTFGINLTWKS
jgi:outer membrane immunogenic protein